MLVGLIALKSRNLSERLFSFANLSKLPLTFLAFSKKAFASASFANHTAVALMPPRDITASGMFSLFFS